MEFKTGQRWISQAEAQLGLGLVTQVADRRVKIIFPAAGESRIYASDNAPLSRVLYSAGDTINDNNDISYLVTGIEEADDLITYTCTDAQGAKTQLSEPDLNAHVQLTTPQQRLFNGQLDSNKNFALRVLTLQHRHHLQQSPVKGLLGSRTNLLPHQIYIANNVCQRYLPRVLLADEVGLGKTIEAGMILHHQIYTGQVARVLILVPDSLIHQWLVEMLRRFNLGFAVFDRARIKALIQQGYRNPFETEQYVLCPLSIISERQPDQQLVLTSAWDMVVVDEAHHLTWTEQASSIAYQTVAQLASQCPSLLLLTATPEQAGLEGHFARLRLIDPARFHSLSKFIEEQAGYEKLNALVQRLLKKAPLEKHHQEDLQRLLGEAYSSDHQTQIAKLLDRHGAGRVLFRNTRQAVRGFAARKVIACPLALPDNSRMATSACYPESLCSDQSWLEHDPRVAWLAEQLTALQPNKVLVICHYVQTAIALDNYLNRRTAIRSACFYEDLSIVERDRAAAYFAEGSNPNELDHQPGAQVLVCSEIGSEGRNFQFSHHLILFDLPANPDLLEQRIGRLDRIGQRHDVHIHIPYLMNSAQEVLFRWLHEGIEAFTHSCPAGYQIYQQFAEQIRQLIQTSPIEQCALENLIKQTATYSKATIDRLRAGRDRLLELNSCNKQQADQLIERILKEDRRQALIDYMQLIFDQFGVEADYHSEHAYVLRPGNHMRTHFPGLKDTGNTVTFDRHKALCREDMEFLSWEHPMVTDSMEMILNSEFGNTAVGVIAVRGLAKGALLIETWYAVKVIAEKTLQLERYLPALPSRRLLDNNYKDYTRSLSHARINTLATDVPQKTALKIIKQTRPLLENMLSRSQAWADQRLADIRADAIGSMTKTLRAERARLKSLQQVNRSIRDEEITHIDACIARSHASIQRATFQLQSIRLLVNNPANH